MNIIHRRSLAAILAFGLPFGLAVFTPVPHIPEKFDILGMIRKIDANNGGINSVNSNIVGDMKQINDMSGATARINGHLVTLSQGITEQDQSLSNLKALSGKQVELSTSLNRLAQGLDTDLRGVNQSSAEQKRAVQQMMETAQTLAQMAKEVTETNKAIAEKLDRATRATSQTVSNMP